MPPRKPPTVKAEKVEKATKPRYRALVGLTYPDARKDQPKKRAEAGAIVDDLPSLSVPWLLEQKLIERVD